MMDPASKLLEYDDLLAATLPDQDVPELIDGELWYKASPRAKHAFGQGEVRGVLDPIAGGPRGGWWILPEPDVRFRRQRVLRPDLAGWRVDRLPTLPDGAVELAPDWI